MWLWDGSDCGCVYVVRVVMSETMGWVSMWWEWSWVCLCGGSGHMCVCGGSGHGYVYVVGVVMGVSICGGSRHGCVYVND